MNIEGWQKVSSRAMYRRRGGAGENLISLRLALLVLWQLSALSAPLNAEPERPYLVIDGTTSPNGRYAIAWTLPKGPQIDWEKFRIQRREAKWAGDERKHRIG